MYLQAAINISFQVVLQVVLTFVLSCIDICFQVVIYKLVHVVFVLSFVYKLLHIVFTSCYNVLQVHVSPRSEVTFGNDVALHKALHKKGVKNAVIYY